MINFEEEEIKFGTPVAPSGQAPVTPAVMHRGNDEEEEYTLLVGDIEEESHSGVEESKEDLLGEEEDFIGIQETDGPTTSEPTGHRGVADMYGDIKQTFITMVKRLHPGDDVNDYAKYNGITPLK